MYIYMYITPTLTLAHIIYVDMFMSFISIMSLISFTISHHQ